MRLKHDILLDEKAFHDASSQMNALKVRTEVLKVKLETMYRELITALNTPAGLQVESTAEKVLIQPIQDLLLVIDQISGTLSDIMATGYYKDVFIKFEELNRNIKV